MKILFVIFSLSFALHAAPTWEQVQPSFKKYCSGCHRQYLDKSLVLGNREAIYDRVKWLIAGRPPVSRDMPQAGGLRQEIMKPENSGLRDDMVAFVKPTQASVGYPVDKLNVPAGFKISLVAKVPGARSLALAPDGTLFVGTGAFSNALDRVYRIKDWNRDGRIADDEVEIFIKGFNNPNGVAIRAGKLYVAEIDKILVYSDVLNLPKGATLRVADGRALPYSFPSDRHHGWKFIRFAPAPNDKWLYVPVGANCNICKPAGPEYSAIHRIDVDGNAKETVALGVRNTVGFDFHPATKKLWFTDNGRDSLGDDVPPDELNEVSLEKEHFGYPYCHGRGIVDPEIGFDSLVRSCAQTTPARAELGAHVAALGMRFYSGSKFPDAYKNRIFIAEHGSWNRSKKSGYRVMTVSMESGTPVYQPFVTGWLNETTQAAWGRPVDVEVASDGSLLISDDGIAGTSTTGAIYKVVYEP